MWSQDCHQVSTSDSTASLSSIKQINLDCWECEICDCTPNERWTDAQDAALARARCVALKPQKCACGRPRFARGADKIYYVIFLEYVNYELVLE